MGIIIYWISELNRSHCVATKNIETGTLTAIYFNASWNRTALTPKLAAAISTVESKFLKDM